MNDTDTPSTPAPGSDLGQQVAALQQQVFWLLLWLVVISATVVFYLFCQARFTGRDYDSIRVQASQIITTYNQNELGIRNFHLQLINYAQTHPSFQPILEKYGWRPSAAPMTAPSTAPTTAPRQ